MNVTTELQAFGLIVTAEPYFAVSQPSDVVIMENSVRSDTLGRVEEISAKYALVQRGEYVMNAPAEELKPHRSTSIRLVMRFASHAGLMRTRMLKTPSRRQKSC